MGQHPFDPIRRFAHIFQHQNRPLQAGQVGRAEQVGGHGEIGHQQRAMGLAAAPALPLQIRQGFPKQQILQPLPTPVWLAGQGGDQRPMDGAALALGQLGPEKGGDI